MTLAGWFAGPRPHLLRPAVVGFVLATVGCGVVVHEGPEAVGDRGTLRFELDFEPAPAVGAFELRVGAVRAGDASPVALTSCTVDIVMLSHGHEATGKGVPVAEGSSCVLTSRSFQMSGQWTVRVDAVTAEGDDGATFLVVVP